MRASLYALVIISGFIISACKSINSVSKNETSLPVIIYPLPPDTARIQFLTAISSSTDIEKRKSTFYTFIVGQESAKFIQKPYGLYLHKGKMYICDTKLDGIVIIDLKTKKFNCFIPGGQGTLRLPLKCFMDGNDNLFVADAERKQVVVFDKELNYQTSFGLADNFKPTDIFILNQKIWVANLANNCINVFDQVSYNLLFTFPELENGEPGYLYKPTSIYVNNNLIYVSDFGDFKIKSYTLDGEFLSAFGCFGKSPGQFVRPKGIAVDNRSNLYVVDAGFENVQVFNKDGQLLMYFGGPYKGKGDMYLPSQIYIDYENLEYFEKYVDSSYKLKYLVFVSNQFGPDKINVYGAIEPKQ